MLFESASDPVPVRWYKAKAGQPWAPDANLYVSGNWTAKDLTAGELGEQPGSRPWRNGADTKDYPVQTGDPCDMDPLLQTGLTGPETTGPWVEDKLECCTPGSTCCDRSDIPSTLLMRLSPPVLGCGCVTPLQSFNIYKTTGCTWEGSDTVCGSLMICTLTIGPDLSTPGILTVDWPGMFTGDADEIVHNCDPYVGDFGANFTGSPCDAQASPFLWLVTE